MNIYVYLIVAAYTATTLAINPISRRIKFYTLYTNLIYITTAKSRRFVEMATFLCKSMFYSLCAQQNLTQQPHQIVTGRATLPGRQLLRARAGQDNADCTASRRHCDLPDVASRHSGHPAHVEVSRTELHVKGFELIQIMFTAGGLVV